VRPPFTEFKMGVYSPLGWMEYQRGGFIFRKRFSVQADLQYPDMGCNVEIYCNDRFAEIETLSPLSHLNRGEAIKHTEVWEILPTKGAS